MEKKYMSQIKKQILQARGLEPADYVLKNCMVIDVFCGTIIHADIAICGNTIAGVGKYDGLNELECNGSYVCPGFMEGHIHIESSMLSPRHFCETVLHHGTTTVVCDPHEIANVAGIQGIKYILKDSELSKCALFVMAPSCVPATGLENSGASLSAADLEEVFAMERVIGLAEMMNFPGVLGNEKEVVQKIALARKRKVMVDGHAPGLTGADLQAYIGTGIMSDHECTTVAEAREKLSSGMYLFIREGSTAKNLEDLIDVLTTRNSHRCLLVTDDCHPEELLHKGHIDKILRKAIRLGLDPITAIQMVTVNVANCFGLLSRGAVAPGKIADLVLFNDLHDIRPTKVFCRGEEVKPGQVLPIESETKYKKSYPMVFDSMAVDLESLSFSIRAESEILRVMLVEKDQLITKVIEHAALVEEGCAVSDIKRDILKIAVVERHNSTGNIGKAFVQGIGLREGAIASTVSHDSHNIIVIGCNDSDMTKAVQVLVEQGGGLVFVCNSKIEGRLVLNIAGLMSTADVTEIANQFSHLLTRVNRFGIKTADPFMLMSFLALPVIPHLKITDLGLVNVDHFCLCSLWAEKKGEEKCGDISEIL